MPDASTGAVKQGNDVFRLLPCRSGGLLFGTDIGVIAGALPFIADEFRLLRTRKNGS